MGQIDKKLAGTSSKAITWRPEPLVTMISAGVSAGHNELCKPTLQKYIVSNHVHDVSPVPC